MPHPRDEAEDDSGLEGGDPCEGHGGDHHDERQRPESVVVGDRRYGTMYEPHGEAPSDHHVERE
jgi:hypothetical protein